MNYTIVAIAMLMVSVPVAFAETFEIETPWAESSGHGCHVNPFNEDQYICTFDRYPTIMTLEDLEEFKHVLTEEEYEQAKEDIIDATVEDVVVEKPTPKTPTEILVERLMEKDNPSEADLATIRALENLHKSCEIGIEEGARIQDYGKFLLPDRSVTLDGSFNLKNYQPLRDILMKTDECNFWNEYREKYLRQYLDIELDDHTDLKYWAHTSPAIATVGKYNYPAYFVQAPDPELEELKSRATGCEHNYWKTNLKIQNGCNVGIEYEHDPSLQTPIKDYINNPVWKSSVIFKNGDESHQLNKNIINARESEIHNYGGQN